MSSHWFLKSEQVRENLVQYLRTLPLAKGLEIRIHKANKTPPQRAYWHCMVRIIAEHVGKPEATLKDELKAEWLPVREHRRGDGKIVLIPKATEDLTKEEYSELIEKTMALATFLELQIPSPEYMGIGR